MNFTKDIQIMKAFTFLCKKFNLSLFDNTLTIYDKPLPTANITELEIFMKNLDESQIGVLRFVYRSSFDHELYHQDNLDREVSHWHMEFAELNKITIESFLGLLVKKNLMAADEKTLFLKSYKEANIIPNKEPILGFTKGFLVIKHEKPAKSGSDNPINGLNTNFEDKKQVKNNGQSSKPLSFAGNKGAFFIQNIEEKNNNNFGGFRKGFFDY